jgi:D-alanine-D-alanine ligase
MAEQSKARVAVLAGGDSDERVISLKSGAAVHKALSARGFSALSLDPSIVDLAGVDWCHFDVAFIALHGRFGEDGQVQQLLSNVGIPYTGSDARVSRLAFSKSASKERFLKSGVPTPRYLLVHDDRDTQHIQRVVEQIGFPLVVKPDCQGSSLGISIVRSYKEVLAALNLCFQYDRVAVVEEAVLGTEWTVGFLDDLALPAIRIETEREFFDWHAKYDDDQTQYLFESDFSSSVVSSIEATAHRACRALGTRGLARVDLRLDQARRPWVLEINTVPGFTNHSLVPKAAAKMGIEFGELCEHAIFAALPNRILPPHILPKTAIRRGSVRE